jgi:hypothetical protein
VSAPRWLTTESDDGIHVMPLDDDQPHKPSTACQCNPARDQQCDAVLIHPAWDRRDVLETIR